METASVMWETRAAGGVVFVEEDDLLEAVDGELLGDLIFLFGDAVGVESEDVARGERDDGVGELGVGQDATTGPETSSRMVSPVEGRRSRGGLWPPQRTRGCGGWG